MAYIPDWHLKYGVLPLCRELGGEVFSYSSGLAWEIDDLLPPGKSVIPYGFYSYEEFYEHIDNYILKYRKDGQKPNKLGILLGKYKKDIKLRNIKENWSIVKYVGKDDEYQDLTYGKCYYWPCSIEDPNYEGVIDDEEFTSYYYLPKPGMWEILEDPLGMARRTLDMMSKIDKLT